MLDWLHWGGQLVLIGGAGPGFSIFRESFLGPYLPADPTGETVSCWARPSWSRCADRIRPPCSSAAGRAETAEPEIDAGPGAGV